MRVRPAQFEQPDSYLQRLCQANAVEQAWLRVLIRRRYLESREPDAMGVALYELGGPAVSWWHRSFARASVGMTKPRTAFARQGSQRTACHQCTHGAVVTTFDHIRFAFCRKHGRWLAPGTDGRVQRGKRLTPALLHCERKLNAMVAAGRVVQEHQQLVWDAIRDYSYLSGQWSPALRAAIETEDFVREVDDRLALFPEFVRILDLTCRPEFLNTMAEADATGRRGYLHRVFAWLPGERWVLCEALDAFFARQ